MSRPSAADRGRRRSVALPPGRSSTSRERRFPRIPPFERREHSTASRRIRATFTRVSPRRARARRAWWRARSACRLALRASAKEPICTDHNPETAISVTSIPGLTIITRTSDPGPDCRASAAARERIDDAPLDEGAAVVDSHADRLAVLDVRDIDDRAKGQLPVRGRQQRRVVDSPRPSASPRSRRFRRTRTRFLLAEERAAGGG